MTAFTWSSYQEDIFDDVATFTPGRHLLIQARAGAAKTTTIVEAARRLPPGLPTSMIAFNRHIAAELRGRVPEHVKVDTLHGLGLRWIRKHYPSVEVSKDKGLAAARIVCAQYKKTNKRPPSIRSKDGFLIFDSARIYNRMPWDVARVTSLVKTIQPPTKQAVVDIARNAGLDNPIISAEHYAKLAIETCQATVKNTGFVDFDDMIYWPRKLLAPNGLWGDLAYNVFIDEAQDLSNGQRFLATSVLSRSGNGRVFAVGDDRQGLYGWRGAGATAMADMQQHLHARQLPLSVTYRCPVAVVDFVKEQVKGIDDLQAADDAIDGFVDYRSLSFMLGPHGARGGDFVLSRLNAPLVTLAVHYAASGVKVAVMGKDLKTKLIKLIESAKQSTVPDLRSWVRARRNAEHQRLEAIGQVDQLRETLDETSAVLGVLQYCDTPEDAVSYIQAMFNDEPAPDALVLSTIHRAKGYERDRVWMLEQTINRGSSKEEENCFYVAATRAKKELYLVNMNDEPGLDGDLRYGDLRINMDEMNLDDIRQTRG